MPPELIEGMIEMVKQGGWGIIPIMLLIGWIMAGFKMPWSYGCKHEWHNISCDEDNLLYECSKCGRAK